MKRLKILKREKIPKKSEVRHPQKIGESQDKIISITSDMARIKFLWQFVRLYRKKFILVTFFLLLTVLFNAIAPIFYRNVLNTIQSSFQPSSTYSIILPGLSAYLILMILGWQASVFQTIFSVQLNSNVTREMRLFVYDKIIRNYISFFDNNESGVLTGIITNDIHEIYDTGEKLVQTITSFFRLFATIGILFYYSPKLTIISLLCLPLFFIITLVLRKFQRGVEKTWRKNFANVNQSFSESMNSISVSKVFAREKENVEKFTDINEKTYHSSIRRGFAIFIIGPFNDFFRHLLLIFILIAGTIEHTNNALSVASFYLFVFVLDSYYWPILQLARNYSRFQSVFATLERILSYCIQPEEDLIEIKDKNEVKIEYTDEKSHDDLQGNLSFQNVNFSYLPNTPVLQNVSFEVKGGNRVAIVGHTGAGKSTIAALILRFYNIQSGNILLDQKDIRTYTLSQLRKQIGVVNQNVLIFKGTVRENIQLGNNYATDEDIWNVLSIVQAQEFIEQLPQGLNTLLEENGKNLSTGQRQMIAFARVLLSNPRIIILDEATSAVDLYTESKIQDATDNLLKDRTSIVIAHRLTTILNSDLIVVLDKGKVVQIGCHTDLVHIPGPYQEMYTLYFETQSAQFLEQIKIQDRSC